MALGLRGSTRSQTTKERGPMLRFTSIGKVGVGALLLAGVGCSSGGGSGMMSTEGVAANPQTVDHATYEHVSRVPGQPAVYHRIVFVSGRLASSTEYELEGRQLQIACST